MDRLLRGATLATLLGVTKETLRYWHNKGWLDVADTINSEIHYRESAINAFLAREVRGMAAPTYNRLLKGEVTLVSARVAQKQLGVSRGNIRVLVRKNRLAATKIGAFWRIEQASLEQRVRLRQYTVQNVARIIGTCTDVVCDLIKTGELAWADDPDKVVNPATLAEYVRRHLPKWARPNVEEWIEQRLDSQRPLLIGPEVCRILALHPNKLSGFLERERIGYIYSPRFELRRVSPEALDDYLSLEPAVPSAEVADWFGVDPAIVRGWSERGLLVCPIPYHNHNDDRLYESCWLGILQPLLSKGSFASNWLGYRKRYRARLLGLEAAAVKAGVSAEDMAKVLEEKGVPSGIRTPDGEWRVSVPQMKYYAAERRRV